MCGIAGWFDKNIDFSEKKEVIGKVSQSLIPRGPDENGAYITNDIALIHRRLVVIDRENGTQPMTVQHKDRKYTIVYNGELYNTEEVRTKLIAKGFKFRGRSDTEVVLKSYIQWGKKCVEKLNGIFAFGIYEMKSKELFICRDRIGVNAFVLSSISKWLNFCFGNKSYSCYR